MKHFCVCWKKQEKKVQFAIFFNDSERFVLEPSYAVLENAVRCRCLYYDTRNASGMVMIFPILH